MSLVIEIGGRRNQSEGESNLPRWLPRCGVPRFGVPRFGVAGMMCVGREGEEGVAGAGTGKGWWAGGCAGLMYGK